MCKKKIRNVQIRKSSNLENVQTWKNQISKIVQIQKKKLDLEKFIFEINVQIFKNTKIF
jgi:hypothetical protein